MLTRTVDSTSLPRFIWQWLTSAFVQDVPETVSACEFQCHRTTCLQAEWATCPRRLSRLP